MTTILGDLGAVSAGGGERSERARKKFEQRKVKNERKSCPWVSEDLRGCMTTNSVTITAWAKCRNLGKSSL